MQTVQSEKSNYYDILGIAKGASKEEIKKAYRKLSLLHHPDKNKGSAYSSELYKKISEAYNVLSNDKNKTEYDNPISDEPQFTNLGGNVYAINIDPSTMMNMLFGQGGPINQTKNFANNTGSIFSQLFDNHQFHSPSHIQQPTSRSRSEHFYPGFSQHTYESKPAAINKTLEISFQEAFTGCKIPIDITRWIIESDLKMEEIENIYVTVPKGIDNNEIITLENKGNAISDTNKGDIKIKIVIKNETNFERNGIDLIYKKTISLKESLCGFSFDLKYIDGREFKINNESGNIIPANFRKIVPSMGMQRENDVGNLVIVFDIDYPKTLTSEQVTILKKTL